MLIVKEWEGGGVVKGWWMVVGGSGGDCSIYQGKVPSKKGGV